ncbi:MAG: flavocytochrome c [Syntrophaceae bacterium]
MWDKEYDVVIIGSGFAGLAAAIEARKICNKVIVLEKMPVPGGNSSISGGMVAAAGSPLQTQQGIKDSPELMLSDMLAGGLKFNYPELARIVAEKSTEALLWTIHELGAKYEPILSWVGGHSVPRTYISANASGSGIIKPMLAKCREMNILIQLKACLTRFIADGSGTIEGIEILEDHIFPNRESGRRTRIRARRAVVLATGGFSQDKEFRSIQNPMLTADFESTNHRGATAESLIAALRAGATPVQLSMIQLGPWASRDEEGFGVGSLFSILAGFPYGILIDLRTGTRFINEQSDRKILVDSLLRLKRESIAIVDQEGVSHASTLAQCLKRGVVKKYGSIEELASANQVPLAPLLETIASYNLNIEKGMEDIFGKPLPKDLAPMKRPPYYSIRLTPKVHHCMGGIQINSRAQVIGIESHQPIGRFYAAGEIAGGIHGASRLGSNAIPECLIFGRIAGVNAADEPPRT